MQEVQINFVSDSLMLEGCLALPENSGDHPYPGVLLCHPHPLYGGTMDSNVIIAVSSALAARGIIALRFNFRGVGQSQGSFAKGIGELEDAYAALSFLSGREEVDPERMGIAGYSFGGMVALSAGLENERVKAMAGISPIVPSGLLQNCTKPVLITYGTKDDVVFPEVILQEVRKMTLPAEVMAVNDADHFWWGFEKEISGKVADFLAAHLVT